MFERAVVNVHGYLQQQCIINRAAYEQRRVVWSAIIGESMDVATGITRQLRIDAG